VHSPARFATLLLPGLLAIALATPARAVPVGRDADLLRTGWYADEPGLSPLTISGGSFGQLFSTAVTGQVYAQPLVFGSTLFVATQSNWIYGLDPATGAVQWSRSVGTPWNASDIPGCTDIYPTAGITATPVIDDVTGIAYFTSKTYKSGSSGAVQWKMHAVSVATGAEQSGFPVVLSGNADNDHSQSFPPATENQRCGLLLLGGAVYAAFASDCDTRPFQGWVIGVSTVGAISCRWVDRTGTGTSGGGIWMSGSALVSDGPGQILLASGNGESGGTPSGSIPGNTPPADLGESIVRLAVQGDGSLLPTDFFTPYNSLADYDPIDADLGSGGVVGLPGSSFGTLSHPELFVQGGKPAELYVLDGSSLGGCGQGPGGTDGVVSEIPLTGGMWSKPAVWGGDGGWIYFPTADTSLSSDGSYGNFEAMQSGLDGSGRPTFTLAGSSADHFGFSSSAPIVTSNGTTSGSALVWIVWNPDGTGNGAQLRAYDPIPAGGTLHVRWSAVIGQGSKFNPPGVSNGRIYVGTRDGHLIAFGVSATSTPPAALAGRTQLGPAYPNPFARSTRLELALAHDGPATVTIYDAGGRRVRQLLSGPLAAGTHSLVWEGRDDAGATVPAGLYLARLDAGGTSQTRRVVVVR